MRYCFRCPVCGNTTEYFRRDEPIYCGPCARNSSLQTYIQMTRDYRAENASVATAALKQNRERGTDGASGRAEMRDLFLPTVSEIGEQGVRDWNDSHIPRETNRKPLYPEVPRQYFPVS